MSFFFISSKKKKKQTKRNGTDSSLTTLCWYVDVCLCSTLGQICHLCRRRCALEPRSLHVGVCVKSKRERVVVLFPLSYFWHCFAVSHAAAQLVNINAVWRSDGDWSWHVVTPWWKALWDDVAGLFLLSTERRRELASFLLPSLCQSVRVCVLCVHVHTFCPPSALVIRWGYCLLIGLVSLYMPNNGTLRAGYRTLVLLWQRPNMLSVRKYPVFSWQFLVLRC